MTIRDVIHGDIEINDPLVLEIITTTEFQRLRRIKQLGLTYTVFPSADHTRYTHSLGVYYLARLAVDYLKQNDQFKYSDLEIQAFQLSCLLHDLGHGPLSHTAESFFGYKHEEYSTKIILDPNGEINNILKEYNPDLIDEICLFIAKKHENSILISLLSSSVDIDRMDYLLRDSLHCGVVYGAAEYHRILSHMEIHNNQLCYSYKAMKPIEDFILSRFQMFSQVYLNEKSLAYEQMIGDLLKRIKQLLEKNYNFKTNLSPLIPFFNQQITIKDYITMDDYVLMNIITQLKQEDDNILSGLSNSFSRNYPMLKTVNNPDDYFEVKVNQLVKKHFYNETVCIVGRGGEINKLEEVSSLMNFAKNELEIIVEEQELYVRK